MTDIGITFKCPKCNELIKADQADAGQEGSCPTCGVAIVVPGRLPPPPPQPILTPPRQSPPPPPAPASPAGIRANTSGFAVTSLIMGILSIVPGLLIGGPLLGILAIVFSCIARSKIRKNPLQVNGSGLAIAGLVTGIVGLAISLILTLLLGAVMSAFGAASKAMLGPIHK